jgi:glycosyltransferase 2 family protein
MAPDESEQPAPRRKPPWALGIRMVVSAALLAVLVSKIDFDGALPKQRHLSTLAFFGAAVLMATIGIVLSAWRWQRVLLAFGTPVPLRALTGHYFAGQFVGNVLPSTIGGDVLRISRSSKDIGSSETAFAAVALERLSGFLALPVLCLLGFLVDPSLLESSTAWVAILVSGIALAALAGILFLAAHPRLAGRFREHDNWMRFIGAAHVGVERLRNDPRAALAVLGTAMIYQVSVVMTVGFVILTIGAPVPVGAVIAFVPVVAMAQVIPISLSGLGVREGMFVLLLHPLGIPNGQAIGIGLLWYLTMLLVSFLGAPAFAVGNRRRAAVGAGSQS